MDGNEPLLDEARALVAAAVDRDLSLRLLGGLAVRAICATSRSSPFARVCDDADFFTTAQPAPIEELFDSRGWRADRQFNLYNGSARLKFSHEGLGKGADIFLGRFSMCHEVKLGDCRGGGGPTIPLADLLLTKLQVVEANDKDLADCYCLLADHGPGGPSESHIAQAAFAAACARDWGLYTTVERSLDKLRAWVSEQGLEGPTGAAVLSSIRTLQAAAAAEPKTLAWKARSLIGTRLRWYELPEEVERC